MKKDAYYFSHDSNARHDENILKMRIKEDWYGYGLYWALIEMLRDATDHKLKTDYELIAFELRTDCESIKTLIENYNLFVVENGVFYSSSLKRRMKIKEEKSGKARQSAQIRWEKSKKEESQCESDANALQTECNKSKGNIKESKLTKYDNLLIEDWKFKKNVKISKSLNEEEYILSNRNWLNGIDEDLWSKWQSMYLNLNLNAELKKALNWVIGNTANRKQDLYKYYNGWLNRSNNKAIDESYS